MTPAPSELIEREARTGFLRFYGMRLSGSIPVTQDVLNELLSLSEGVPKRLRVEIERDNRLVARLGLVQATATLQSPAALDGRTVTLELASSIVAWTVSQYLSASFITIAGRVISIDLARVPGIAPWRASLAHLERMTFSTQPGVVTVNFDWRVKAMPNDGTRAE